VRMKSLSGNIRATGTATKDGQENGPGVTMTIDGLGSVLDVQIDSGLAGELRTIEKLTVGAYANAKTQMSLEFAAAAMSKPNKDQ